MTAFDTERDLMARLPDLGISRLADTTRLDRVGIPTVSVVKPGTTDVCWVYSGKGVTRSHARVTAIMECLERTAALWPAAGWRNDSAANLATEAIAVWPPDRFTERLRDTYDKDDTISWTVTTRVVPDGDAVVDAGQVWVPADLVFSGRRPAHAPDSPYRYTTTNGLAAHTSPWAAVQAALLELIERDAVSHAEVVSSHFAYASLAGLARKLGLGDHVLRGFRDDISYATTLEPSTLPQPERDLLARFHQKGLTVTVKSLPTDVGVAVVGAACAEQVGLASVLACAGYGASWRPQDALRGALLELAQTRATDLQGAREDRGEIEKQRVAELPRHHWLITSDRPQPWSSIETAAFRPSHGAGSEVSVAELLRRMAAVGLSDVAVARFSAWPGIHAVRLLVPGIETWHATGGWSRLGPRLAGRMKGRE